MVGVTNQGRRANPILVSGRPRGGRCCCSRGRPCARMQHPPLRYSRRKALGETPPAAGTHRYRVLLQSCGLRWAARMRGWHPDMVDARRSEQDAAVRAPAHRLRATLLAGEGDRSRAVHRGPRFRPHDSDGSSDWLHGGRRPDPRHRRLECLAPASAGASSFQGKPRATNDMASEIDQEAGGRDKRVRVGIRIINVFVDQRARNQPRHDQREAAKNTRPLVHPSSPFPAKCGLTDWVRRVTFGVGASATIRCSTVNRRKG